MGKSGIQGLAGLALGLAVVLPGPAPSAAPLTLTCIADSSLNWRATPAEPGNSADPQTAGLVLNIDPKSGRWFLQNPAADTLTADDGIFRVQRHGLEKPFDEWIGVDGDTMLRISGNLQTNRFIFVARGRDLLLGHCLVPEQPFRFPGEGG